VWTGRFEQRKLPSLSSDQGNVQFSCTKEEKLETYKLEKQAWAWWESLNMAWVMANDAGTQADIEAEKQRQAQANFDFTSVINELYGANNTLGQMQGYFPGMFGSSSGLMSKGIPVVGGVLSGLQAGDANYRNDPNMTNKRNNFGTNYPDMRAHVGGAVLGGVMGYFGGPAGAAFAGPAVELVHPYAEQATRTMINFGDSWGGAGGAMMMDPIGTLASGKYGVGELAKGMFLGPIAKWLKL